MKKFHGQGSQRWIPLSVSRLCFQTLTWLGCWCGFHLWECSRRFSYVFMIFWVICYGRQGPTWSEQLMPCLNIEAAVVINQTNFTPQSCGFLHNIEELFPSQLGWCVKGIAPRFPGNFAPHTPNYEEEPVKRSLVMRKLVTIASPRITYSSPRKVSANKNQQIPLPRDAPQVVVLLQTAKLSPAKPWGPNHCEALSAPKVRGPSCRCFASRRLIPG